MARRQRELRTSVTSQIEQFRSTAAPIEPRASLTDAERTYFNQIVTDREAASWSPNHLTLATNLAKTYAAIDKLWEEIDSTGFTLMNERGTLIANPALNALNTMMQASQALNRTLGLSASQRGLSGAKQGNRNRADREVGELNAATDQHSLLA